MVDQVLCHMKQAVNDATDDSAPSAFAYAITCHRNGIFPPHESVKDRDGTRD